MSSKATYTTSAHDGLTLTGHIWDAPKPVAVMSLVHGFGEHSGRYDDMAQHLNGQGISVVSLDIRGHGLSEGKRGVSRGMDDYQADLKTLLEKTRDHAGDLPHILYGHSMGGGIVMHYGFNPDADIRAIITSAPLIKPVEPIPDALRVIIRLINIFVPKGSMAQPIDGSKVSSIPKEQRLYEQDTLNHFMMGFGTAVGIITAGEAIAEKAAEWTMPLLLMHARQDQLTQFTESEAFAKTAKNVQFIAHENVQHEMHNDTTRVEVYNAMTTFIKNQIGA